MKTAPSARPSRQTANPRRTTLAHLKDAETLRVADTDRREHVLELPAVTANPRRTVLIVAPAVAVPAE
ncbi:hypothetical protein [Streptomyces sp. UNOB3_S3]|uniref:hypothetical protein n=1 Tax=Streptomyces sp. UNOB3_S3 TaxID=2871682 RepID=UPI001E409650|nr:hypothetical protein [Streptomyces sp. UNOB3_S3]MCC3774421.1 hypothetical protein [Streptomyces sp. UNOB3_S3]